MMRIALFLLVLAGAGASEAPTALAASDQSRYVLFPGDLLHVEVFGQPDLTCSLRVTADGTLTFPLVGSVPGVTGMTVADLTAELRRRYQDGFLNQALVSAAVQEFAPRTVYVMGSVRTPGVVPLSPFGRTTAMQAIVRAGGFLPEGNRAATLVVRDDPARPGGKISLVVPVADNAEMLMVDVALQADDLVVVPQLDRVSVIGNVRAPGAISLPGQGPLTVTRAIALVGGFEKFARSDRVQLIRAGAPTLVIDVAGLLAGTAHGQDPALKPGDTLFIPESRF
jgi:polysaccharide export outer membrane protein